MPTFPDHHWDKVKAKLTKKIKTSVKARVSKDSMDKQHVHLQTLLKQGEALKFLHVQQQDPTWRGYLYNLKKGTMKFILNSSIHTYAYIKYIVDSVDISKFIVFSDIPGFQTTNGGSLPADMAVTTLKPNVVLLDHKEKTIHLFELTVNWESNSKEEKNNIQIRQICTFSHGRHQIQTKPHSI